MGSKVKMYSHLAKSMKTPPRLGPTIKLSEIVAAHKLVTCARRPSQKDERRIDTPLAVSAATHTPASVLKMARLSQEGITPQRMLKPPSIIDASKNIRRCESKSPSLPNGSDETP